MKVCVVVLNSIWHDPRVRKQINGYLSEGVTLTCVGYRDNRYDPQRVAEIPCKTDLLDPKDIISGKQRSVVKKIKREIVKHLAVRDLIIRQEPDVIHANDLDALIPAYLASRKRKCKLIYDSHEVNTENIYYRDKRLYASVLRIIEKYICKRVDKMVCVSHAAAEYFAEKYTIPVPMVVTNCSIKAEQCVGDQKNEGFEILNHGQFYEGRGYDLMVEALPLLKEYPEIKLAFRGFGMLEDQLRSRAAELGDENFQIYPPVHVSKLIAEASASMVGVAITVPICLNFRLSVSNKLFEYASAGLPVIMSDIPEHRYLNEKYDFGVIMKENTPQAFADAAIYLYENKAVYERLAQNAQRMSDEVNWETEFGRLIAAEYELFG